MVGDGVEQHAQPVGALADDVHDLEARVRACHGVEQELGVELDMVRVKPSNNFANVNGSVTGGGMGSECNCSVCLIDCLTLKVLIKFGVRRFLDDVPLDPFGKFRRVCI